MTKRITMLLFVFLFILSIGAFAFQLSPDYYAKAFNASGYVETEILFVIKDKKTGREGKDVVGFYGSFINIGTKDGDSFILTASHCINSDEVVKMYKDNCITCGFELKSYKVTQKFYFEEGKAYDGWILFQNVENDVGLVRIKGYANPNHLDIVNSDTVKIQDEIQSIGCLLNEPLIKVATNGNVVSFLYANLGDGWNMQILTDCSILPGMSGGACINSSGQIFGLNHGGISKNFGNTVGIITSSKTILEMFKKYNFDLNKLD